MLMRWLLIWFWFMVACCPSSSLAEEVVFYADDLPPYIQLHEQGPPTGFAVELMWETVCEAGITKDDVSIEVVNWARAVSNVRDISGVALLCLALLPERIDSYKWVGPIDYMEVGLFADKNANIVLKNKDDIFRYRIGVVRNTALISSLKAEYPGIEKNLVDLRGIDTQLRMLREGRVDLIAQALLGTKRMMPRNDMRPEDYPMVRRLEPLKMHFGFNKSFDDGYISRLQTALDRLKKRGTGRKSRYDRIRDKYFEFTQADN